MGLHDIACGRCVGELSFYDKLPCSSSTEKVLRLNALPKDFGEKSFLLTSLHPGLNIEI